MDPLLAGNGAFALLREPILDAKGFARGWIFHFCPTSERAHAAPEAVAAEARALREELNRSRFFFERPLFPKSMPGSGPGGAGEGCALFGFGPEDLEQIAPEALESGDWVAMPAESHAKPGSGPVAHGLVEAGFALCVDRFALTPDSIAPLAVARAAMLPLSDLGPDKCQAIAAKLSSKGVLPVVSDCASLGAVAELAEAGVERFCGSYWLQGPHPRQGAGARPKLEQSSINALRVMALVYANAQITEIEEEFKKDATLSYRLISLINSAGMRPPRKLGSIREALLMMGMNQLTQWLALLLASGSRDKGGQALAFLSACRARECELAAARLGRESADQAFLCGLFSLLEPLLGRPLEELLAYADLPDPIQTALLLGSGELSGFLEVAKARERQHSDRRAAARRLEEACRKAGVTVAESNIHSILAFDWASRLFSPATLSP